jgi:hypothetical protein
MSNSTPGIQKYAAMRKFCTEEYWRMKGNQTCVGNCSRRRKNGYVVNKIASCNREGDVGVTPPSSPPHFPTDSSTNM